MYACAPCVCLVPSQVRRGYQIPLELELDSCDQLCGYWEFNIGSLEQQPVILTTKPSLQP